MGTARPPRSATYDARHQETAMSNDHQAIEQAVQTYLDGLYEGGGVEV